MFLGAARKKPKIITFKEQLDWHWLFTVIEVEVGNDFNKLRENSAVVKRKFGTQWKHLSRARQNKDREQKNEVFVTNRLISSIRKIILFVCIQVLWNKPNTI